MLIDHLGWARERLLDSFAGLSDADLNRVPGGGGWSIAAILLHVAERERLVSDCVLDAAEARYAECVEEIPEDELRTRLPAVAEEVPPPVAWTSRAELTRALETSRFRYLQRVFNKTHAHDLVARSLVDPQLGRISLKNAVDLIWLRDELHTRQIEATRAALV